MKKFIFALITISVFAGCALLSPYSVTFTTPDGSVVDPASDTLDLAVNMPTLAYISEVTCGGEALALLPVLTDEMEATKAHNLSLELLDVYEAGTECEVGVTVLDNTTTANSRESITLYVLEMPAEEVEEEEVVVEEEVEVCEDGTICPSDDEEITEPSEDSSEEEPEA